MPNVYSKTLILLFLAQLVGVSTSVTAVQIGGIVGNTLAARPELATLPLSFAIVGTALSTIPAALLMQRFGRRIGFSIGALVGAGGLLLAAAALRAESFVGFCTALSLLGFNLACVQQYRFAAAESVPKDRVSRAISLVLLGSIGGAFAGPRLVSSLVSPTDGYVPVFLVLAAALVAVSLMLFALLGDATGSEEFEEPKERTPLRQLARQPGYLLAVAAGALSYGVMTFVMTATPLSMHVHDGHSLDHTGWVITAHVLAMYLPSLVSGALIDRFGPRKMMMIGLVLLASTILVGLSGRDLHHYTAALIALGVGWNLLYIGATTALVGTYQPQDRFRAQAVNEFSVFTSSALASLLSGALLHIYGWGLVLLIPLPFLLLLTVALARPQVAQTFARLRAEK